jgi:hypothetical protein
MVLAAKKTTKTEFSGNEKEKKKFKRNHGLECLECNDMQARLLPGTDLFNKLRF